MRREIRDRREGRGLYIFQEALTHTWAVVTSSMLSGRRKNKRNPSKLGRSLITRLVWGTCASTWPNNQSLTSGIITSWWGETLKKVPNETEVLPVSVWDYKHVNKGRGLVWCHICTRRHRMRKITERSLSDKAGPAVDVTETSSTALTFFSWSLNGRGRKELHCGPTAFRACTHFEIVYARF